MSNQASNRPPQAINWERALRIFENPKPPQKIWQQQFDGFDDKLQELARTPHEQIDFSDMWYYHHDMTYVRLQPDLFAYLFPVCLMDWHQTLQNNEPCSHGDSEFHHGIYHGRVFEEMLTPDQLTEITFFFRDSYLERLDHERLIPRTQNGYATFGWLMRFNSLGSIIPNIEHLWNAWWSLETPGRAITAIQYCSSLMYFEGENPLFDEWNSLGPCLCDNDTLVNNVEWIDKNIEFLSRVLTVDFVNQKFLNALDQLNDISLAEKAQQLKVDLPQCQEVIALQIDELLCVL